MPHISFKHLQALNHTISATAMWLENQHAADADSPLARAKASTAKAVDILSEVIGAVQAPFEVVCTQKHPSSDILQLGVVYTVLETIPTEEPVTREPHYVLAEMDLYGWGFPKSWFKVKDIGRESDGSGPGTVQQTEERTGRSPNGG